jgi:hypothetical protein
MDPNQPTTGQPTAQPGQVSTDQPVQTPQPAPVTETPVVTPEPQAVPERLLPLQLLRSQSRKWEGEFLQLFRQHQHHKFNNLKQFLW